MPSSKNPNLTEQAILDALAAAGGELGRVALWHEVEKRLTSQLVLSALNDGIQSLEDQGQIITSRRPSSDHRTGISTVWVALPESAEAAFDHYLQSLKDGFHSWVHPPPYCQVLSREIEDGHQVVIGPEDQPAPAWPEFNPDRAALISAPWIFLNKPKDDPLDAEADAIRLVMIMILEVYSGWENPSP